MSDLDRELRQAIQAEVERSLEGFTFTPEMRRAVLERIAAEEQPLATPAPARRTLLRPATWIVAAAAALVLAVKLWPDMPSGPRSGTAPESSSVAQTESTGGASGAEAAADAAAETARTKNGAVQTQERNGEAVALTAEPLCALSALPPGEPVKLELKVKALYAAGPEAQGAAQAESHESTGEPRVTVMSAAPAMLDLTVLSDGSVALLTSTSLRVVDQHGNVTAEEPLDYAPAAFADGAADGAVVVGDGVIARYGTGGQLSGVLATDSAPLQVSVAFDRTAVADADGVTVYAGDTQAFRLRGMRFDAITLAEDGALAGLSDTAGTPRLRVYDATGNQILDQTTAGGSALAFLSGGSQVAAGSEVYDRTSGELLWTLPFAATHAVAAGGHVLAWNAEAAALLEEATGQPLWVAEAGDGGVILNTVSSAGGDMAAVVAQSGEGVGVWVIDAEGAERYTELLSDVPVDVAIVGDHLHILTPAGLEVRSLSR